MGIKVKRRKVYLIIVLSILLISLLTTSFYIKKKVEDPYKKLFLYCTEEEGDKEMVKNCRILLSDYYENDNGKLCLGIVLPEIQLSKRDLTLCLNEKVLVNWKNPYESYTLNLPVAIEIKYSKFPLIRINEVNIQLLSDKQAHELIDPINKETTNIILFKSLEASKMLEEKGYYTVDRICKGNYSEICVNLGVYEVELLDVFIDEDGLKFHISMSIMGDNIEEIIVVEEFQFEEYSYSNIGTPLKREVVDLSFPLEEILSKGENYVMEFTLSNHDEITDNLVKQYSEGIVDFEIKLESVLHYVK